MLDKSAADYFRLVTVGSIHLRPPCKCEVIYLFSLVVQLLGWSKETNITRSGDFSTGGNGQRRNTQGRGKASLVTPFTDRLIGFIDSASFQRSSRAQRRAAVPLTLLPKQSRAALPSQPRRPGPSLLGRVRWGSWLRGRTATKMTHGPVSC